MEALEESLLLCRHCGDAEGEGRAETMLRRLRAPPRPPVTPGAGPDVTPVPLGKEQKAQALGAF